MAQDDQIRIWDAHGKEQNVSDTPCFDSWDLCKREKRFPNGLIQFLSSENGCAYEAPSVIQSFAWPALLQGQDVIGIAKTGSGKTLAFLLPAFMWLKKNKKSAKPVDLTVGPAVLCLTPTRELCFQIYSDAAKFGEPVQITAACCFGGQSKQEQEWKIKAGPHCLIATPGRLNDFINTGVVRCEMCRFVILDEADRMLDMGFEPQIRKILEKVPLEDRQTSLFTATWNHEVRKIADNYITNPVVVQIGSDQITSNANITQHIEVCQNVDDKKSLLKKILSELDDEGSCLVFCNTKKQCTSLCWDLHSGDLKAVELHGDLKQDQRDESLNRFRSGDARVLIATDLAARGLDIRKVHVVVNFDVPRSAEDYVHRIGRTGRANDKGDSYTFMNPFGQEKIAKDIKVCMEQVGQEIPEALEDLVNSRTPASTSTGNGSSWGGEDKWWEKKDNDKDAKKSSNGKKASSNERRVHPADKDKIPYDYAGFQGFAAGDERKAQRMWGESKVVQEELAPEVEEEEEEVPPEEDELPEGEDEEFAAEEEEGPPHKRARTDPSADGTHVDQALVDGRGNELSLQALKKWLGEQGLETSGLKKALVERAETAAQEAMA